MFEMLLICSFRLLGLFSGQIGLNIFRCGIAFRYYKHELFNVCQMLEIDKKKSTQKQNTEQKQHKLKMK